MSVSGSDSLFVSGKPKPMPALPLELPGSRSGQATAQAGNAPYLFSCILFYPIRMDLLRLRKRMRQQRRELNVSQQRVAARQLSAHLQSLSIIEQTQHFGLYLGNDGEINPSVFMDWAFAADKHCYLPILHSGQQAMSFGEITPDSHFKPNRFKIPEPVVEPAALLGARQLDVILMPLVAFDLAGNRIGMGGGYYDRTLAFTRQQPYHRRPILIGLAHAFQCVDHIEPAPWDIPLDGIVTEKQPFLFDRFQPNPDQ